MESRKCVNCLADVSGNYCSNCGLQVMNGPYNLSFIKNSVTGLVDFDRGFFYTFYKLLVKPVELIHPYLHGNSKKAVNPLKYLLTCLTLTFILDQLGSVVVTGYSHDPEFVGYFIALLLCITLLIWNYLLARASFNFTEHLIIGAFESAQLFLCFSLIYFFLQVLTAIGLNSVSLSVLSPGLIGCFLIFHTIFIYKNVFGLSVLRSILLTVTYTGFVFGLFKLIAI